MVLACVAALVVALVLPIGAALWQVEDWSRDLITNMAATDPQHQDGRLHPVNTDLSPREVAEALPNMVQRLPGWEVVNIHVKRNDNTGEEYLAVVDLIRTTPILGFKDDVRLTINHTDGATEVTAVSRSRVGKGDLGQNPRNLREILGKLRSELGELSIRRQK